MHTQCVRFVRIGRAKGPKQKVKSVEDENSDAWEGGVEHGSCQEDNNDSELLNFLQSNTDFVLQMSATAGFSDTLRITLIYKFCLLLLTPTK